MAQQIMIRKAQPGDEACLAYIQTESWKAAFSHILSEADLRRAADWERTTQMYARLLQKGELHILIEEVDGTAHCIACWGKNRDGLEDDVAELYCIHSLPGRWGQGYGSPVMRQVLREMEKSGFREAVLWVFAENSRARKFYEKHGFAPTGRKQQAFGAEEMLYQKKLCVPCP